MVVVAATTSPGASRATRRRSVAATLLIALAAFAPVAARAAQPAASEYELKAAFLYNFAKFVDWPPEALESSVSAVRVCVLGDDPFGAVLDQTLAGQDGPRSAVRDPPSGADERHRRLPRPLRERAPSERRLRRLSRRPTAPPC